MIICGVGRKYYIKIETDERLLLYNLLGVGSHSCAQADGPCDRSGVRAPGPGPGPGPGPQVPVQSPESRPQKGLRKLLMRILGTYTLH